jgi:hypothetical protein
MKQDFKKIKDRYGNNAYAKNVNKFLERLDEQRSLSDRINKKKTITRIRTSWY